MQQLQKVNACNVTMIIARDIKSLILAYFDIAEFSLLEFSSENFTLMFSRRAILHSSPLSALCTLM